MAGADPGMAVVVAVTMRLSGVFPPWIVIATGLRIFHDALSIVRPVFDSEADQALVERRSPRESRVMVPRYAPAIPLPPYSYVPGHDHPHPLTDARGHAYHHGRQSGASTAIAIDQPPADARSRCRSLATTLTADPQWLHAIDLFNSGFYWEAHEAWEQFWIALGRTTLEARFVQGLIHIAAAAVKIREGRPAGVASHARRAEELLRGTRTGIADGAPAGRSCGDEANSFDAAAVFGLTPDSLATVVAELATYEPECWHTSRTPVVRVLAAALRLDLHS